MTGGAGQRLAVIAAGLAVAAGSQAAAEDIRVRPADCAAIVTYHRTDCQVATIFRCGTGDAAVWREEATDESGTSVELNAVRDGATLAFVSADGVFASKATGPLTGDSIDTIIHGGGTGTTPFIMDIDGIARPGTYAVSAPHVPAEQVTIDEVALTMRRVDITMTLPKPMTVIRGQYTLYLHEPTGAILSGGMKLDIGDGSESGKPVEIIFPDAPGFGSTTARHGCPNLS